MVGRRMRGILGEDIASAYLELRGHRILERNYRMGQLEIDLITSKGGCLAFVEVKTRSSDSFGAAIESIGRWKLTNIKRAAGGYISRLSDMYPFEYIRFDVIAIDVDKEDDSMVLRHIKGVT